MPIPLLPRRQPPQLSPCDPAFSTYARIFVTEFRVMFAGARAKLNADDNARIAVKMSTPGTSVVRAGGPQLELTPYVMTPRISDFYYYLRNDPCALFLGGGGTNSSGTDVHGFQLHVQR